MCRASDRKAFEDHQVELLGAAKVGRGHNQLRLSFLGKGFRRPAVPAAVDRKSGPSKAVENR
jgi:hypothetical protein